MDFAKLVLFTLQCSIFLTVFALGLNATFADSLSLLRRPAVLLRSLASMYVIMPVVAVLIARALQLDTAVAIALLVLSVSPVPPFLPLKGTKVGTSGAYMFGLMAETAVLSVVVTPVAVVLLAKVFGVSAHVAPMAIAVVVLKTVLVPLGLGMLVRVLWPGAAQRLSRPIGMFAIIVLGLCFVLLLVAARDRIGDLIGNGTLAAIALFSVIGLIVGHLMGGPVEQDRTFLAFATPGRHPGVAFAIAHAIAPEEQKLILAAILLYLVVLSVVSAPYARWRKRGLPTVPQQPMPHPSH
jgi:BASS family bile acid:Na+ symporter